MLMAFGDEDDIFQKKKFLNFLYVFSFFSFLFSSSSFFSVFFPQMKIENGDGGIR